MLCIDNIQHTKLKLSGVKLTCTSMLHVTYMVASTSQITVELRMEINIKCSMYVVSFP